MIISFGKTLHLLPNKSVTRRKWAPKQRERFVKAWREGNRRHQAYDKSPRNQGKHIGWVTLTKRPYREQLFRMPREHLALEGGDCKTVREFIDKYFEGVSDQWVTVVHFNYEPLNPEPATVPSIQEQTSLLDL